MGTCCGSVLSPYHAKGVNQDAQDEFTLTAQLRAAGQLDAIDAFRASRVSKADFEAMARQGITSVRVPFPWWILKPATAPGSEEWHAGVDGYHVGRGLSILDDVVAWGEATGVSLVLELHAAPGGQSNAQTTGHDNPNWNPTMFDPDATLRALEVVALRYNRSDAVVAISPLNEPTLPTSDIVQFYRRAYTTVRACGMTSQRVAFVVQLYGIDAIFKLAWPFLNMRSGLGAATHPNVVFDLHLYYGVLIPPLPRAFDYYASCAFIVGPFVAIQSSLIDLVGRPVLVGEWSLRTPYTGEWLPSRFAALTGRERNATMRALLTISCISFSAPVQFLRGFSEAGHVAQGDTSGHGVMHPPISLV